MHIINKEDYMYLNHDKFKELISLVMFINIIIGILLVMIGSILNNGIIVSIGIVMMIMILILPLIRGLFKSLACIMGWHSYHYYDIISDGINRHGKCKWCGFEGTIDSQGNLF